MSSPSWPPWFRWRYDYIAARFPSASPQIMSDIFVPSRLHLKNSSKSRAMPKNGCLRTALEPAASHIRSHHEWCSLLHRPCAWRFQTISSISRFISAASITDNTTLLASDDMRLSTYFIEIPLMLPSAMSFIFCMRMKRKAIFVNIFDAAYYDARLYSGDKWMAGLLYLMLGVAASSQKLMTLRFSAESFIVGAASGYDQLLQWRHFPRRFCIDRLDIFLTLLSA